eukprot:6173591-Pleurochrysis_carterae.AAC.7
MPFEDDARKNPVITQASLQYELQAVKDNNNLVFVSATVYDRMLYSESRTSAVRAPRRLAIAAANQPRAASA